MTPVNDVNSNDWTGGPSPVETSRLDIWTRLHPWKAAVVGIMVISAAQTLRFFAVHDVSIPMLVLAFSVYTMVMALAYGSMFFGVFLFAGLANKINRSAVADLGGGQKIYVIVLLMIGLIASQLIGPILVSKGIGFIAGHL